MLFRPKPTLTGPSYNNLHTKANNTPQCVMPVWSLNISYSRPYDALKRRGKQPEKRSPIQKLIEDTVGPILRGSAGW